MRLVHFLALLSLLLSSALFSAENADVRVDESGMGAVSAVILVYHHVATDTPPSTTIAPDTFRGHMDYLRDNDFTVIGLDQLIASVQQGTELPDKAIVISFDDGYESIYTTAFPMLQEYQFPFTLFVSTEPINNRQRNYMNWDQITEMSDAGVLVANHMVTHPYMTEKLEGESDEEQLLRLQDELLSAETDIEAHTGQHHKILAYPYGEYTADIKTMIDKFGYVGIAQNSGAVGPDSDLLALPRFPVAGIYANLDSAKTKFETLAFRVELVEPLSPLTTERNPRAVLKFSPGNYNADQLGCFANGQAMPMNWIDKAEGLLELVAEEEYSGRRWRYICTAPHKDSGRYYWYSVQWINIGD